MKAGFMKTAAVLFSTVLVCSASQIPSLAEQNDGQTIMFEKTLSATFENQRIIPGKKLPGNSSIRTGNSVSLKAGNYAKWIDRVELPDKILNFYDTIVEASDNDGEDDFLITGDGAIKTWDGLSLTVTGSTVDELLENIDTEFDAVFEQIQAAYNAFDRDHTEVFWLNGQVQMQSNGSFPLSPYNGGYKAEVPMLVHFGVQDTYQTAAAIQSNIALRDSCIQTIMDGAPAASYDKVKYFNSWLTGHNGYNSIVAGLASGSAPQSAWECVSALKGSRGTQGPVCEGYARAFKVLCDNAGIECTLVDGFASSGSNPGEGHMWNYVKLNNKWYAMDVTWNDPIVDGIDTDGIEDYFLVGADTRIGQKTFLESHPVENQVSTTGVAFINGPVLNSSKYESHTHTASVIPAVEPTCTKDGLTEGSKCSECGEILAAQETVKALGHNYNVGETIEPTCTEKGYTTYTCSRCADSYKGDEVAALGHAYTTEVTKPTCTEEGYTTHTCSRCNDTYTDDKVAAAGHKFAEGICTVCGAADPNYVKPDDPSPAPNPFADVPAGQYYTDSVLWALSNGVTAGVDDTHFAPEDSCTRAQVVTFLWRAKGKPSAVKGNNPFVDVNEGAYYYDAVLWAYENGVVSGMDDTHFGPEATVTRAQFVTFLYRSDNKPSYSVKNPFVDVPAGQYYTDPILWAYENGVTAGVDSTHFGTDNFCTRGQVVTFLYRALK